jgi:beta-phosphoglucomutase
LPIQAMIFDLDGTLVRTEYLKACSYARAIQELQLPQDGFDDLAFIEVIEAFKDLIGLPRKEVSLELLQRFALEDLAQARMAELGVSTPWEALVKVRFKYYDQMLADPAVVRSNTWSHNLALLAFARQSGCGVGLATMSVRPQVAKILSALNLADVFDVIASREDVENPKPDPEIYRLVSQKLDTAPENCLVIEDSVPGVQAALSAGMHCIAVTTPMTHSAVHAGKMLDERWIVDDPADLTDVVRYLISGAGRPGYEHGN